MKPLWILSTGCLNRLHIVLLEFFLLGGIRDDASDNDAQTITGAIKHVGTVFFWTALSNELLATKPNRKAHRGGIGEYTHSSLINFLIEDDFYSNLIDA